MVSTAATLQISKPSTLPRKQVLLASAFGLGAVVWFMLLSGWLGVTPGHVITKRQNVLFNSDTSLWVERMMGNSRSPEQLVHPLEILFWRYPSRALAGLAGVVLRPEYATLVGPRLLVALVAGVGVGFLTLLAFRNEVGTFQFILLFVTYMLFTSNSTVCLPEHFGISNGLLTIAFVVPFLFASVRIRTAALAVLTIACGGTTITNMFFPAASLFHYVVKSWRVKLGLLVAGLPPFAAACLLLYKKSYTIHWFVKSYLNLRLIHDPIKTIVYTIFAMVAPAIGPKPLVLRWPGWDMVSYEPAVEPLRLSYYSGIQALSAAIWAVLLVTCVYQGLKDNRTRPFVWVALSWLAFNAAFHNIWGTEIFLNAPHWSWALMAVVLLGARHLSRTFVGATVVLIAVGQISTFIAIRSALQTITR